MVGATCVNGASSVVHYVLTSCGCPAWQVVPPRLPGPSVLEGEGRGLLTEPLRGTSRRAKKDLADLRANDRSPRSWHGHHERQCPFLPCAHRARDAHHVRAKAAAARIEDVGDRRATIQV